MPGQKPSAARGNPVRVAAFTLALVACREAGPGARTTPADAGGTSEGCASAWLEAPVVDRSIALPDGTGHLVLHAAAKGTQDYVCAADPADASAGGYGWSLKGPEATLTDCHSAPIGRHFASDAGSPEWQLSDGTYVVAHKAGAFPASAGAVPWLLLGVDGHGGEGRLAEARYIQRVRTVGGGRPDTPCDAARAGSVQKVPYEAEYFFFAPSAIATAAPSSTRIDSSPSAVDSPAPDAIIAQHVLVAYRGAKRAPKGVTRSKADARARAEEALAKLRSGAAFEDVVKTYSDDAGSVDRMGSLGKFGRGDMDPTFAAAAFALRVGQVSDVVQTPFGFHLIKRTQ